MFYFRHISNWDFIGPQRFKHTIAVIEACEHTHTHADFFIDFSIRMYACVEFCDVKTKISGKAFWQRNSQLSHLQCVPSSNTRGRLTIALATAEMTQMSCMRGYSGTVITHSAFHPVWCSINGYLLQGMLLKHLLRMCL